MGKQLTKKDIEKMEQEIEYRKCVVRKEKLEAVKEARAQGDLSENFEYYAAKKDKNANERRIRYLDRLVRTADIIDDTSADDEVGIDNTVTVYFEDDDEEETYRVVTSVRADVLDGRVSNVSPIGRAIMGHKVGSLTLHAGIAGGADIILIPEIPYDINVVVNALKERNRQGKRFSILAVAEGAISKEDASLTKKELKEKKKNGLVYPSVAYELGAKIEELTGQEVRVTVPGHTQRGGEPCAYDRVLSTRLGAEAAGLILNKEYGYMVCVENNEISKVPLEEVAGKLKTVDSECSTIKEAKMLGISFGDE